MTPEILAALIASSTALLVAIIGFFGSLFITMRTSSQAVEQMRKEVRYTRAHERRDEVLATIYDLINKCQDEHVRWLTQPYGSKEILEQWARAQERLLELRRYFDRNMLWIPEDPKEEEGKRGIYEEVLSLLLEYRRLGKQLGDALESGDEAEYNEVKSEAERWLNDTEDEDYALRRVARLHYMIKESLGITELDERK